MIGNENYIEIMRDIGGRYNDQDAYYFSAKRGNIVYFHSGHSGFTSWLDKLQRTYNEINDSNIGLLVRGEHNFEEGQISAIKEALGENIEIRLEKLK